MPRHSAMHGFKELTVHWLTEWIRELGCAGDGIPSLEVDLARLAIKEIIPEVVEAEMVEYLSHRNKQKNSHLRVSFNGMVWSSAFKAAPTSMTAAKMMFNSSGDSTNPCRRPCVTQNLSEISPSSIRIRARIPSWNWRATAIISSGIASVASTFLSSSRSTESYAFFTSTKHM